VTCNHVIYHIPADRQSAAFEELWSVLRPGGVGVVVYAWQGSPIASGLREELRSCSSVARRQTKQSCHSYSLDWFRSQKWPFHYQIDTFRIVDNEFMKKYISDSWLGRAILYNFLCSPGAVSRVLRKIQGLSGDCDPQRLTFPMMLIPLLLFTEWPSRTMVESPMSGVSNS
jgi:hypothetical protein